MNKAAERALARRENRKGKKPEVAIQQVRDLVDEFGETLEELRSLYEQLVVAVGGTSGVGVEADEMFEKQNYKFWDDDLPF